MPATSASSSSASRPRTPRRSRTGSVRAFEYSEFLFVAGLRASLAGLPFLPTRGARGSDLVAELGVAEVTCPYTGERLLAAPALRPDVCVLHAEAADEQGNVLAPGARDFLFDSDQTLARASERVVVTVERIVPTDELRGNVLLFAPRGRRGRRGCRGAPGRPGCLASTAPTSRPCARASSRSAHDDRRWTPDEQLVWCLARRVRADDVLVVGVATPLAAAAAHLARAVLEPDVTIIEAAAVEVPEHDVADPFVRPDDVAAFGRRRPDAGRDPRRDPARPHHAPVRQPRPGRRPGALNTSRVADGVGRAAPPPRRARDRRRLTARRPARRLPRGALAAVPARRGRLRHGRARARRRDRDGRRRARVGRRPLPPRLGARGRVGRGRRRRLRLPARHRRAASRPSRPRRRRSPSCASAIDPHGLRRLETREGRPEALRALEALAR